MHGHKRILDINISSPLGCNLRVNSDACYHVTRTNHLNRVHRHHHGRRPRKHEHQNIQFVFIRMPFVFVCMPRSTQWQRQLRPLLDQVSSRIVVAKEQPIKHSNKPMHSMLSSRQFPCHYPPLLTAAFLPTWQCRTNTCHAASLHTSHLLLVLAPVGPHK
jgi:hypothetical protein